MRGGMESGRQTVLKIYVMLALVFLVPAACLAGNYKISSGDKLSISVAGEPEYQTDAIVRLDGKIAVHALGDVDATGLTTDELQGRIVEKLKEYIRKPTVTVALAGSGNDRVFVTGGGVKPVTVDIAKIHTLLPLITGLGDVSAVDMHNASVTRDGKEIKRDFSALLGGDVSQDIPLMAGDTVTLPPQASNRGVYVTGAVNVPKMVVYREGMTLLEAILEAGGFSKFASPDDTKIVRQIDGQRQIIPVKAKRLVKDGDMAQNVVLRGGDLIIVEESFF